MKVAIGIISLIFTIRSAQANDWYRPISIPLNQTVTEQLTSRDLPTGEGGFAKDFVVELKAGEQVAIDLTSDSFDTVVMLIADDGSMINSNDDSTEGGTDSLLFVRIKESGRYIIRVKTFEIGGGGTFQLKVSRLSSTG